MTLLRRVPVRLVRVARAWLPSELADWGRAAEAEVQDIASPAQAWLFALAFVAWALREGTGLAALTLHRDTDISEDAQAMIRPQRLQPRASAALCGVGAVALGLVYMGMSGAPIVYLLTNLGALGLGAVGLAFLALTLKRGHLAPGPLSLALGLTLLAVSQWGVTADGVTRWVSIGPLAIQPGLIVAPLVAVLFARSPGPMSLAGVVAVALALALQPDRGTAGAVAAGMIVLALVRPSALSRVAAVAATAGFAVTLARPDASPAMPYVDQILFTSFASPVAGLAVILGSVLLIVPALGSRGAAQDHDARVVFGAAWVALVVAAALGNYPTPLVGYGGSAIIGYFLSLIAFPQEARAGSGAKDPQAVPSEDASAPLFAATN